MAPDLDGKRLELLKEAFPKVARVAFLWAPGSPRRKPGPHRDGGCGQGVGTQTSIASRCEALTILRAHLHERKAKRPGAHYDHRSTYQYSATPSVGLRGKEPVAGYLPRQ